ncbi:chromosomal replication initiator DnaA [Hyphomonas sp. WL0036]|uniref:helix-turn-helix domain-containing protein n=1 Tax=Hyphomonas sediminis TaxID=2866160 RepID=UPI001C7EB7A4|nr:helix-turn-helix domain-containing protein [Hyphomonas sediminis]MBY9065293.1 chromosomal replication initiator DnaA [Hyphomonas sediminis]
MADFNPRKDEDRAYLAGALVAYALGLKQEDVLSAERGTPVHARARHIAMYLTHAACGMSLARVARAFGRDRSTVSHACQIIEDYREDPDFDIWLEQLSAGLLSVAVLRATEAAN